MIKHTEGSWKVDGKTELCITDDINRFIASASIMGSDNNYAEAYEEAKANARLMAAAPDLLEALEIIHEYWDRDYNSFKMVETLWFIVETAEQAIAKAKGGL